MAEPPCGIDPTDCYADCTQRHICRWQREQIDYWTDEDLERCERCGQSVPIENTVAMVDCTYCQDCYDAWYEHFQACQHQWEPAEADGEAGRYCHKCAG